MSTTRAVARGTLRLLTGQVAARGLDFLLYLLLARRLGVEGFGLYTYALSFTFLFNVLADFGVSTVLTREAARTPQRTPALLRDALTLKVVLSAAALVAILGVAALTRAPAATLGLIAMFALALLLNSVAQAYEGLLRAAGRAGTAGVTQLCAAAARLATAAALVLGGIGVLGAASAHAAAGVVHLASARRLSRDLWRERAGAEIEEAPTSPGSAGAARAPGPTDRWRRRMGMLREAAPLALSWLFIALYFRIDAVMLQWLQDERAVGLYASVYRVFEVFAMLAVAFRSVLFPVMARAADGPRDALAVLCRKSLRLHLLFTILVAVFFTVESHRIVTLVLGPEYAAAAPALSVLIWALPGSYMADTLLHLLIAQRRQTWGTWVVSSTAIFNVTLNLALIPRFSFLGAAAATVASELLCFSLLFAVFRRGVPRVGFARLVWPPLVAGAVAAALLVALAPRVPDGLAGLALAAPGAFLAYLAVLVLLRAVGPGDWALVRDLLPAARAGGAGKAES